MVNFSMCVAAAAAVSSVTAFVTPSSFKGTAVQSNVQQVPTMKMSVQDMLGADVETNGLWDPLGLSSNEASLYKYRVSEIKHGRVAMLATVGEFVQQLTHLPDPVFSESRPLAALAKVYSERPEAIWQIILFLGFVEVYLWKQDPAMEPGNIGGSSWSRYKDPELRANKLTKELKNGRLAMVAIMGMWYQEYLTGQGPLEQIISGHTLPFGDGQGYF